MSLVEEYLHLQKQYTNEYGDRTLVFMQVGTFYCLYSIEGDTLAADVSDILGCRLTLRDTTKKSEAGTIKNPYMIGFPCAAYEKYHHTLMLNNYTIVLYDQSPTDSTKRILADIKSPVTSGVSSHTRTGGNKIYSVYIECLDNKLKVENINLLVGVSSINVSIGKTEVKELYSTKSDCRHVINELYRILSSNKPKELLVVINYSDPKVSHVDFEKYLIDSLELNCYPILILKSDINKEYLNPKYQEQFLLKVFRPIKVIGSSGTSGSPKDSKDPKILQVQLNQGSILDILTELNLENLRYATVSYILLLQYCYEHDELLISKIKKPTIISEHEEFLNLTYNAAIQLNLIPSNVSRVNYRINKKKSYTTVLSVLDNTRTNMGRRTLQERLLNPVLEEDVLRNRYNIIDELRNNQEYIKSASGILTQLYDLEKLNLKLIKGTISPKEFCNLFDTCKTVIELINLTVPLISTPDKKPTCLYSVFPRNFEISNFNQFIVDVYNTFIPEVLEECNIIDSKLNCRNSPLRPGRNVMCDNYEAAIKESESRLSLICEHLDKIIGTSGVIKIDSVSKKSKKGKSVDDDEDEEIINTKDLGIYLPPGRADKLKSNARNIDTNLCGSIRIESRNKKFAVRSDYIDYYCNTILNSRNSMSEELYKFYTSYICQIGLDYDLGPIIQFIIDIDLSICNTINSLRYNYVKPEIVSFKDSQKSFIEAIDLRHPLVERIINTEYISNNVSLGSSHQGIILYACNSAGKTVLATSVPLAIIMAQAGMWTAGKIKYTPYKRIITRLSGQDDVLKGHSSFVVEMLELRTILNNSDLRSLLIGDELCRGTEGLSAMAITISAIDYMVAQRSSFIFSTHLHGITDKEPLCTLINKQEIKVCHLTVRYNPESGYLIYDRKLKEGSGESIYGLEVAKSLDMNNNFLMLANKIRRELQGETQELLNFKTSRYNPQIRVDSCVLCGKKIELQTHHIKEQAKADSNGFIGDVYKDDLYNLIVVCRGCHENIHCNKIEIVTDQGSQGLILNLK